MNINEELLNAMKQYNRNTLLIGCAGCGKSTIIKEFVSARNDVIVIAPSGIAAWNIGGRTMQSFFSITPYQYTGEISMRNRLNDEIIGKIKNSNILLIDEISMLRCEILDIVDYKLRCIRGAALPFGGIKLLFLGDFCQMGPVTLKEEYTALRGLYKNANDDYNFYNANVMRTNNFFNNSFDIYKIDKDYRHKDDIPFRNMLATIRMGKISARELAILNERYIGRDFFNENYQYLTVTNSVAAKYNSYFYEKLKGVEYISNARIYVYYGDSSFIKNPFKEILKLKENMRIIFVKNDNKKNGNRWVNGSMGRIIRINSANSCLDDVFSVVVEIRGVQHEIFRERYGLMSYSKYEGWMVQGGSIEQFPFIPSWAITIDKSQGLTLDRIAIVMENRNRENQMYVALSRARKLNDVVILERKVRPSDICFSDTMKDFLDSIKNRMIMVEDNKTINSIVNINEKNYGTIIIHNHIEKSNRSNKYMVNL
ncbi:MAG: AAA family ATPase [Tannerellaceae bacterium]|nr:AAA family ATPase [Tannerellaceae bacterium]